jgi:hypothetical protein
MAPRARLGGEYGRLSATQPSLLPRPGTGGNWVASLFDELQMEADVIYALKYCIGH